MIYFLESPYIKKLYMALSTHQSDVMLLPHTQLHVCTQEDVLILDESDLAHVPKHVLKFKVIGEGQGCISKFQPYKEIAKRLINVSFPVVFATSNYLTPDLIHSVHTLWHHLNFDYFVDCTLNAENPFSLYTYAMNRSFIPEKKKKYAVINHIKDAINPPQEDITSFINHLKQTGSTLVFSAPLKGTLDVQLINLSDMIVFFNYEGKPPFLLSDLSIKQHYMIPIIDKDKTFEKHTENLISDIKRQWGGAFENL